MSKRTPFKPARGFFMKYTEKIESFLILLIKDDDRDDLEWVTLKLNQTADSENSLASSKI